MNYFTKLCFIVAVIGTVGILHAMVDLLATPGTKSSIQYTQDKNQVRKVALTREVASAASETHGSPQVINNIYDTDTGSFYFISLPSGAGLNTAEQQLKHAHIPAYHQAPTMDSHFDVSITGPIARTKVTQTFENNAGIWQDGIYVFPLPTGAAVDSLVMRVGDREIIGEIHPKKTAQEMFEKARVEGKKASLVQQIRPDIFRNQLSNIPPNEEIIIEIEYQQLLQYSDEGFELRLPTGIKEKYTPANHDPEDIEETSGPQLHPTEIEIDINMGLPIKTIESLHHPVDTQQYNSVEYYLKTTEKKLNGAMFVLRWTLQEDNHTQLSHMQERSTKGTFGMLSMLAPSDSDIQLKRDITFILDTSGSMVGNAIEQAKAALTYAIEDLAYTDRFNIIEFNSNAAALWGASSMASDANKSNAIKYLTQLEANGGTEMLSALDLAFELTQYRQEELDRVKQVIFITDGSVANEADILAKIKTYIGNIRLFTIGIGNAPNGYFMYEAAITGKGLPLFIGDIAHVDQEMQRFLRKIKQPAWTDLAIETLSPDDDISFFPQKLPDIYAGEPFFLFYKTASNQALVETDAIKVLAKSAAAGDFGNIEMRNIKRQVSPSFVTDDVSISKQWAHEKIQHYMRLLNTTPRNVRVSRNANRGNTLDVEGENDFAALEQHVQKEVTALALAHSLVTRYTSLIAIDHEADEALLRRRESVGNGSLGNMRFVNLQGLPSTSANIPTLRFIGLLLILIAAIIYAHMSNNPSGLRSEATSTSKN